MHRNHAPPEPEAPAPAAPEAPVSEPAAPVVMWEPPPPEPAPAAPAEPPTRPAPLPRIGIFEPEDFNPDFLNGYAIVENRQAGAAGRLSSPDMPTGPPLPRAPA